MDDAKLRVVGLVDLQKALRDVDKDLPKELAAGLAEAAEIVASAARAKMPQRTGRAAGAVKAKKAQRAATIAMGGTAAPYGPWLDFGGSVGRQKMTKRPFFKEGRYIYPTLRQKRAEVAAKIDEVLKEMAKKAGFDTEGKSTDA